ncbi:MAG: 1-deoxy-D-xylulose-5-phosphate reductoisomerase [Erysipelotrichaceae bacterium]
MKKIVILGASGSIGTQTLDVVRQHPTRLTCSGISVGHNIPWLREQLARQSFALVCVGEKADAESLQTEFPLIPFVYGESGLVQLATLNDADLVVNALVGFVGLVPTMAAIAQGKDIGLANKETLVVAGKLMTAAAKKHKVKLLPIDSEHSAITQCLRGNNLADVQKLWITASGGSFRAKSREQLRGVSVDQALAHPNWSMGAKITIDSATLVNKAFEVIEAHWLFDIPYAKIEAVIHPESIVHSMVEYSDGSVMAQLGSPDMRLPIQYVLLGPRRFPIENHTHLNLSEIGKLHFEPISQERHPLFYRIVEEANRGGNRTIVVNAANEIAVAAFLNKKIDFMAIEEIILATLESIPYYDINSLEDCLRCDGESRAAALKKIGD